LYWEIKLLIFDDWLFVRFVLNLFLLTFIKVNQYHVLYNRIICGSHHLISFSNFLNCSLYKTRLLFVVGYSLLIHWLTFFLSQENNLCPTCVVRSSYQISFKTWVVNCIKRLNYWLFIVELFILFSWRFLCFTSYNRKMYAENIFPSKNKLFIVWKYVIVSCWYLIVFLN